MKLSTLFETLSTSAIAIRPYPFFNKPRHKELITNLLTPTRTQFKSGGPLPPIKRKPEHKTYLMRRKRVYTS